MVSRRRAADSAVARQGEGNNDTIALEMELHAQVDLDSFLADSTAIRSIDYFWC